uniref:Chitin-binding type-2 domain-containing protein n=1 Tax=Wuchereria bancrofti TaxID=6293 RepID=A0AAF5PH47_WUCBA
MTEEHLRRPMDMSTLDTYFLNLVSDQPFTIRLPDGAYEKSCSLEFILCVADMSVLYDCPVQFIFHTQSEKCLTRSQMSRILILMIFVSGSPIAFMSVAVQQKNNTISSPH